MAGNPRAFVSAITKQVRADKARIEKAVAQKLQEQGLGGDAPLDDAKKHGGDTRLLADRLRALRSGGGGKAPPSGDPETGELKPTM